MLNLLLGVLLGLALHWLWCSQYCSGCQLKLNLLKIKWNKKLKKLKK